MCSDVNAVAGDNPLSVRSDRCARARAGFSFIEIMVVIVIIGLLAGAVAMRFGGVVDKAKIERARSDISVIVKAVEMFHLEKHRYPSNDEGLGVLADLTSTKDPWGKVYGYNSPGQDGPFEVYTLGADGRPGGDDQDADIYSWNLTETEEAR